MRPHDPRSEEHRSQPMNREAGRKRLSPDDLKARSVEATVAQHAHGLEVCGAHSRRKRRGEIQNRCAVRWSRRLAGPALPGCSGQYWLFGASICSIADEEAWRSANVRCRPQLFMSRKLVAGFPWDFHVGAHFLTSTPDGFGYRHRYAFRSRSRWISGPIKGHGAFGIVLCPCLTADRAAS